MTEHRRRVVRTVFGLVSLAFVAIAFQTALGRYEGSVVPAWPAIGAATVLVGAGISFGARGWADLLGTRDRAVVSGFLLAQLGKYVPGGFWQHAGQVGTAAAAVPVSKAVAAVPIQALVYVAAAGAVGAWYGLFAAGAAGWVRLATIASAVLVLLIWRRWMDLLLRLGGRPGAKARALLPPQRAITRSFTWSVGTLVASGAGFAALATAVGATESFLGATAAFALAWAAGFLALPFPAGIGVREAVLTALVGPAAPVLAAAIAHRLVTIAAEAIAVGLSRLFLRPRA
ncbi:MAG TPA: hypothetical protein VGB83_07830 [Actinomycetota bacterium]